MGKGLDPYEIAGYLTSPSDPICLTLDNSFTNNIGKFVLALSSQILPVHNTGLAVKGTSSLVQLSLPSGLSILGGIDSVAPYITVNEQSESNPDCNFHSSIASLLPGDHITRIYLYYLICI